MNHLLSEKLRQQKILGLTILVVAIEAGCQPNEQLPVEVQKQLVSKAGQSAAESKKDPESSLEPEKPAEKVVEPFEVNQAEWILRDQLPWSFAEVQYVGNTRTGYSRVQVDRSGLSGLKQLRIRREDVVDRTVDGAQAAQRKVTLDIFEKSNGELASFRFESKIEGENELVVEGRVVFDNLEISKREGENQPIHSKIPWIRKNWGPFGIQSSLMRSPMKPGETRSAQILVPQLARLLPVLFEAKSMELTPLAQGKSRELLKIDLTIGIPELDVMLTTLFVDELGVIHKTITRSGQTMLAMQVPEETVQRIADQSEFSRGISRRTEVGGDLSSLLQAKTARFLVEAEDQDPYDVLLRNYRQKVKSVNADRSELTIFMSSSENSGDNNQAVPDPTMSESSALIPVDKELIAATVAELLEGSSPSDQTEKAEALRDALHQKWKYRPIAADISSTLVSARERTGSCIEGSHLLAALLRREKIPAHMVCGLLVDPASNAAQFHVWNQAWVDGRWIDLDASIAGPVGVLHIAISTTAGRGQNPYSDYLAALNKISQFRNLQLLKIQESTIGLK